MNFMHIIHHFPISPFLAPVPVCMFILFPTCIFLSFPSTVDEIYLIFIICTQSTFEESIPSLYPFLFERELAAL